MTAPTQLFQDPSERTRTKTVFRKPDRADVPAWLVMALLGGGIGYGAPRIVQAQPPAPVSSPAPLQSQPSEDLRALVLQHERTLAQHAEQISSMGGSLAAVATRTEKLERGQALIQRNQLFVCANVARLAHQPNDCREE